MWPRRSSVLVVLFWLATVSWLVSTKILPSLLVGRPPTYQQIAAQDPAQSDVVSWHISLHGRNLGWASTRLERTSDGVVEFHNRVHLVRLPVAELAPPFLAWLLQRVEGGDEALRIQLGKVLGHFNQASHGAIFVAAADLLATPARWPRWR